MYHAFKSKEIENEPYGMDPVDYDPCHVWAVRSSLLALVMVLARTETDRDKDIAESSGDSAYIPSYSNVNISKNAQQLSHMKESSGMKYGADNDDDVLLPSSMRANKQLCTPPACTCTFAEARCIVFSWTMMRVIIRE